MQPQRILVIGCPGSGKSTLARQIQTVVPIPLIHLDQVFWSPGWVEKTPEEFDQKLDEILQTSTWIIDGNYNNSLNRRMEKAELLIVYDLPRYQCLFGYFKRLLRNWGRTRSDMTENCVEKLDFEFIRFILNFKQVNLQQLKAKFPDVIIKVFTSRKKANQWLHSLDWK